MAKYLEEMLKNRQKALKEWFFTCFETGKGYIQGINPRKDNLTYERTIFEFSPPSCKKSKGYWNKVA